MRLFVAALLFLGCSGSATKKSTEDGGTPDLSVDSVNDLSVAGAEDLQPPPMLSPWGIDSRPSNTTCLAPARPVSVTAMEIGVQPMFPNLALDSAIAIYRNKLSPSDPMRWFVVERGGKIWTFVDPTASKTPTGGQEKAQQFFSVAVDQGGEGGLLAMAFDPDFPNNHIIYVSYTGNRPGAADKAASCNARSSDAYCSNIARYTITANNDGTFSQSAEESIFRLAKPFTNHNGGDIGFGPDGYLYASFGDGGSGGDPQCSGQTLKSPLGKLLRIDPRSVASGYAIPSDNPFPTPAPSCIDSNLDTVAARSQSCSEIYAWGLRNPWRWSFDSVPPGGSGPGVWVADVGQGLIEEVDFVEKGKNYGWNRKEGLSAYSTGCTPADINYVDPKIQYGHGGIARSISGGFIYRGSSIPALAGAYVFGDYGTGGIYAIPNAYGITTTVQDPQPIYTLSNTQLVGFGEDEDHELYAIVFGGAGQSIFKIVPATPPMQENTFPQKLSQTGCVDANDPTKAAPGLIAYEVNAPLWSDGADKRRWLSIPDGTQIHVGDDGHWQLPVGSVLMKEFSLGGQRLETRLLVHHDDGDWAGYTYVWDDTGVDATLIDGRQQKTVGTQTWTFPSRADCLACHTTAAGRVLGPDTRQLNRNIIYPDGRYANQIDTLVHLGMFDGPFSARPGFASYTGSASIEERARTYLHANCAHCHRPGSTASSSTAMNLLFDVSLAQMNACNATPQQGNLGVNGAKLLTPGATATSLISVRMHATDQYRMPKVGSSVIDPTGTSIVDSWITSLTTCP